MGEVVELAVVTTLDIDPDRMLENTIGKLKSVIIIGEMHNGEEWFASSTASGPDVLWDIERAKLKLLSIVTE